jgi:hypothetical protein
MIKDSNAPFNSLHLSNAIQIQLNDVNPFEIKVNSDLYDLWCEVNNQSEYQLIGFLKKGNVFFPFFVDTTKKQLPVYTVDAAWSEQVPCLIAIDLKQFYAFLRLINEHHKKGNLTKNRTQLLKTIVKSLDYPEFWNRLF